MKKFFLFFPSLLLCSLSCPAQSELLKVGAACVDVPPTVFPIQLRSG